MKKNRRMQIVKGLLVLFLIMCMVLPVTIAYAETPTDTGVVNTDEGYVLGDTYQRHSWYSDGRHWVFWTNTSAIVYTSSTDLDTWETPTVFTSHSCDQIPEACCNASDFSLWYNVGLDRVDVAYLNVSGENHAMYYRRGRPESDGTIAWNNIQVAVNASGNYTYSHPSICDNTLNYPFIAYMLYDSNSSTYTGFVSTSTTNDSTWGFATNSSANIWNWTAALNGIYYPSVIPVTNGNVSVQYPLDAGSMIMGQNYAKYDVATDIWTAGGAQYPLPVTSTLDTNKIWYHSEVADASVNNSDDVYMVCRANDSVLGGILLYDRYGDPASAWVSDDALEDDVMIATLSVRDDSGNLVLTAVNTSNLATIYSADYTNSSRTWSTITAVDATNMQGSYIMSNYRHGTPLGYLWLDNGVPFDLDYGCYECSVQDEIIDTFGNLTGLVASLVLSFLIIAFLLGIVIKEGMIGGNVEATKVAMFGIIGIIIIETIVIAFF